MKTKKGEEKIYNAEDLYVATIKNNESVIYYIVEKHETLKEFLFKSLEKVKTPYREILTGFIIDIEDIVELESLTDYYSPLELPRRISKKEILEKYIIINDLKSHPEKVYGDDYDKSQVITRKRTIIQKK